MALLFSRTCPLLSERTIDGSPWAHSTQHFSSINYKARCKKQKSARQTLLGPQVPALVCVEAWFSIAEIRCSATLSVDHNQQLSILSFMVEQKEGMTDSTLDTWVGCLNSFFVCCAVDCKEKRSHFCFFGVAVPGNDGRIIYRSRWLSTTWRTRNGKSINGRPEYGIFRRHVYLSTIIRAACPVKAKLVRRHEMNQKFIFLLGPHTRWHHCVALVDGWCVCVCTGGRCAVECF